MLPRTREDGRVRLRAEIRSPAISTRELWFEVDEPRAELTTSGAEPFVLVTLLLAMTERRALRVVDAPVDPVLLRNLREFQRVWESWFGYETVDIDADVGNVGSKPADAVVAFSGGVDSAFSAWWHTRGAACEERPVRSGMMMHGGDIPLADRDGFDSAAARSRRMTESLDLDLVTVATNAWSLPVPITHFTGLAVAGTLHVLGGGFGAGLLPSTATYRDLVVALNTSPVTDWMLGSSTFDVVHDGARYTRFEKLEHLCAWPEALAELRFCLDDPAHDRNCGICHKCMMTAAAFRILGIRPACFDTMPVADELRAWARTLPSRPYYLQEGAELVRAAVERGLDEPWVRTLDHRIRIAHAKQGIRLAWPALADTASSLHRRARLLANERFRQT
ncbi:MAG: hypothetical protein ACHQIG_09780 [Acidimicrobiia bacterium]